MKIIKFIVVGLILLLLTSCSNGNEINRHDLTTNNSKTEPANEIYVPVNKKIDDINYPLVSEGIYDISIVFGNRVPVKIFLKKNIAMFLNLSKQSAEIIPFDLEEKALQSEYKISIPWKMGKGYITEFYECEEGILIHYFDFTGKMEKEALYYDASKKNIVSIDLTIDLSFMPLGYSKGYGFLYGDINENGVTVFSYDIKTHKTQILSSFDLAYISYIRIVNDNVVFSGQSYKHKDLQSVGVYGFAKMNGSISQKEYLPNSAEYFDNGIALREIESIENSKVNTLGQFYILFADSGNTCILETEDKYETLHNYYITENGLFLATETIQPENRNTIIRIYDVKKNKLIKKVNIPNSDGHITSISEDGFLLFSFSDNFVAKTYQIVF